MSEEIEEIKWNPYGKVTEVIRTTTCQSKPDLVYEYDSFGQRIKKVVKPRVGGVLASEHEWITHWYMRDAQGNVLAIYKQQSTEAFGVWNEQITLEEWNFYGSSRLGTTAPENPMILANRTYEIINNQISNENIPALATPSNKKYRKLGEKVFELVNHLGNILSTISDRKLMHEDLPNNAGYVHHYTAEILSVQEQYAFGMNMPGRSFSVEEYRYGFNGKENQDELMANNNSQDFGARMYDARVGRWWGMDPNMQNYAHLSPYNSFENNPIYFNDPDGKDARVTIVGNTIYISSKIYIYGIMASEKIRTAIQNEIEAKWGKNFNYKGYNVKFNVQVEIWNMGKNQNVMESGSNLIEINNNVPNGRSYVVNGKTGRWSEDPSQWAHEFGHLVGFDDGYIEYYYYGNVQGEKPTVETHTKNAFGENNIMRRRNGKVEQRNINWLCEHVLKNLQDSKMEIKGIVISPPLDKSEKYYKANEVPAIERGMKHNPLVKKSAQAPKNKVSKPVTRYKNVRNL